MKKYLLTLLCLVLILSSHGQGKKRRSSNFGKENPFLQQQWYIGLLGGVNMTRINVDKSYSIISPTNYETQLSNKRYKKNKPLGTQIGLEAAYYFRGFSVSVQPTYQNIKFSYSNAYTWLDTESTTNKLELTSEQEHQVAFLLLPLLFKYEYTINQFTPYVQLGAFSGFLLNASKNVEMSGVDYGSGGTNVIAFDPVSVGATDLFAKNHYGFIAGAGLYYNIGNIRLNLDVQYKLGQSVINSAKNRYQNDRLSGIGDAMDDITANQIAISVGTLFPLRFLSSGFKSYVK
jgi:hypothetical protein